MTRINLVTHPQKETTPKLWVNGKWDNVTSTDIVLKNSQTGKIDEDLLPEQPATNLPIWNENDVYQPGDMVYRRGKIYRSMAVNQGPFLEVLDEDSLDPPTIGMVALNDWTVVKFPVYEEMIASQFSFRKDQIVYHLGELYKSRVNSYNQSITDNQYFEKLTGFLPARHHSINFSYSQGEMVEYQGTLCIANGNINSNTPFRWGLSGSTWRPRLTGNNVPLNWKGVVGLETSYLIGDVVALSNVGYALYVCLTPSRLTIVNGLPDPDTWSLLIDSKPIQIAAKQSASGVLKATLHDANASYSINDLVVYVDTLYRCKNNIGPMAFSLTNFVAVGSELDTVPLQWQSGKSYPYGSIVWQNGNLYTSNSAINGATSFNIGLTGATWKQLSPDPAPIIPSWNQSLFYSVASQVVYTDGHVYRALSNISSNTAWNYASWQRISDTRVFGDMKQGFMSSNHDGWYLCNGANVSTLPTNARARASTLGFTSTLPDMRDRVPVGVGSSHALRTAYGSNYIGRNQLPNVSISFSGSGSTNGPSSTETFMTVFGGPSAYYTANSGASNGSSYKFPNFSNSASFGVGNNSHTHTFSFSGSTSSMNGGVSQQRFEQPGYGVNFFIYLGLD